MSFYDVWRYQGTIVGAPRWMNHKPHEDAVLIYSSEWFDHYQWHGNGD